MLVVVGRIGRAHGIRGELSVDPRTDFPERRFAIGAVLQTDAGTLTVRSARRHSAKGAARWLLTFTEVADRTAAERLGGMLLSAEVPDDEQLEDDEYFDRELIGLDVEAGGVLVGSVTGVVHSAAQDTLEVRIDGRSVLVPFVAALVEVDRAAGRVVVADRPGLLNPDAADEVR